MTELVNKSLLICTIKKSADVLNQIATVGVFGIIAIVVLVIMNSILIAVYNAISSTVLEMILVLFGIQWYVYVGVAILAVPSYSLVWCIARKTVKMND